MERASKFSGYNSIFATRLRKIMEENHTTQSALAKETGLTRQSISQYMDGSILPNVEKLHIICRFFGIPSDYLLGFTDSKSTDIEVQNIYDKWGLSSDAMENLEKSCSKHLTGDTEKIVDFVDFILSNQEYMKDASERLTNYSNEFLEYRKLEARHKTAIDSEEADIAGERFSWFVLKLARDCFGSPVKRKPGRKRKVKLADNNSIDDDNDILDDDPLDEDDLE